MEKQNIILHPDAHWVKIDDEKVQLRQPDGNCITFDKYADDITNALKTLSSNDPLDIPVDVDVMSQLKELLNSKGLLVDMSTFPEFHIQRLINQQSVSGRKITKDIHPTKVSYLGEGKLADIVRNSLSKAAVPIVEGEDKSSLLIVISDQEDHKLLKTANIEAIKNNQPILFFRWVQRGFKIGPFVVPGQTACLECAYHRELASSLYPEELEAYQNCDVESLPKYEGGPVLDELAGALITRQVLTILSGKYDLSNPSAIITANPVTLAIKESHILQLPRCGTCNNQSVKPKRAIRDLL